MGRSGGAGRHRTRPIAIPNRNRPVSMVGKSSFDGTTQIPGGTPLVQVGTRWKEAPATPNKTSRLLVAAPAVTGVRSEGNQFEFRPRLAEKRNGIEQTLPLAGTQQADNQRTIEEQPRDAGCDNLEIGNRVERGPAADDSQWIGLNQPDPYSHATAGVRVWEGRSPAVSGTSRCGPHS